MVQRKAKKAKGKAKGRARRASAGARKTGRKAAAKGGAQNAAAKRIAALEAENRRLRAEIAALQGRREEGAVPAFNLTAEEAAETSPAE